MARKLLKDGGPQVLCGDDGGWSRQRQAPCTEFPLKGRTRCKFHGGRVPMGSANGGFRHGRYSKDIPTRALADYEASRADPHQLNLTDEIAAVDARISDLFRKVDTGESSTMWLRLREAWEEFATARDNNDAAAFRRAMLGLEHAITRGVNDSWAWIDLHRAFEQRRRLVETEHKHRVVRHEMIAVERLFLLLGTVHDIYTRCVRKHVDEAVARSISQEAGGEIRALTVRAG